MIATYLGVRQREGWTEASTAMQAWVEAHGMQVYTPQIRHGESANLTVEYDPETGGLAWKPATVNHLASLGGEVMVMSYGAYFSGAFDAKTWRTVRWPDPANPGKWLSQEEMSIEGTAERLAGIVAWCGRYGIRLWMLVDEPAHKADDGAGGGKYGWTPAYENRVCWWVAACVMAELPVWVAMPGPSQIRFWAPRLPGAGWLLNEKHDATEYAPHVPAGAAVGVYNVRAGSLGRLGERLREYEQALARPVEKVLQWSAVPWVRNNDLPVLFDVAGATASPTEQAWELVRQVSAYEPGSGVDHAKALRAQVQALSSEVAELRTRVLALEGRT